MIRLGLIGYPLGHSLSPRLHQAALASFGLEGEYRLYPVEPQDHAGLTALVNRVRQGELDGLNVTIPHKQNVIPLVDELTPGARAIGAVNTLYRRGAQLCGHNTDAPGFLADLKRFWQPAPDLPRRALVIGSGGGARAVVYALLQDGWDVTIAAVLLDQAAALVEAFRTLAAGRVLDVVPNTSESVRRVLEGTTLIVNASPVGMMPHDDESPWPAGLSFPPGAAVYDLVYNPRQTLFVRQARQAGLPATTGLGMLIEQAARAFECWTGRLPAREVMWKAVEE
jgi:shikimate dehydrogenase